MSQQDSIDQFVMRLNEAQQGLYAFILTLVPHSADARDVLSETNMALWRKRDEFDQSAEFWPWACRFARLQVLAYRKRHQRDRLVFGEDLLDKLAADSQSTASHALPMETALEECLAALSQQQQRLVGQRYRDDLSVAAIACQSNRSPGAVSDALYRIRLALAKCIKEKLSGEEVTGD